MSREEKNEILAVEERPAEFKTATHGFGQAAYRISIARTDQTAVNNRGGNVVKVTKTELPHASAPCHLAEEKLRQSERLLRQSNKLEAMAALTGGVVHDFNNLLTAIIGNAQLALSRLAPEDPLRHRLTEIEKATDRAAILTRQLLAFNRRSSAERRKINLNDVATEIFKLLRRIVGGDIEISIECAPDSGQIFADPAHVEQILMNLCATAREALPSGGAIRIETSGFEPDENYLRTFPYVRAVKYARLSFVVAGAPDKQIRARFCELLDRSGDLVQKMNFGLSTVYDVVKQNDGYINVCCDQERETRVDILLPIVADVTMEQRTIDRTRFGGTETVLVAEDEETLRNLARDVLTKLGYTVLIAKNGEEAVEIYADNRDHIDLLLFDVVMPRMSGVEAYEQIKHLSAESEAVPLIFMTGYSPETIHTRFIAKNAAGALGVPAIQKPYNVARLGAAVRDALDARRLNSAKINSDAA